MIVKKRRPGLIIFLVILIAIVGLGFWFFSKPSVAVITDPSFNEIVPLGCYRDLFVNLWEKGYTLRVYPLVKAQIHDPSNIIKLISLSSKSHIVLMSPVVSRAVESFEINLPSLLESTVSFEIGGEGTCVLSDYCLTSDLESGWQQVPTDTDAVLYKTSNPKSADFENDVDFMCVVDYRFSDVIPKSNLRGIICPDFSNTIIPMLDSPKQETTAQGVLFYEYREI